jgi:thiaminase (transcriptional activator TenA)
MTDVATYGVPGNESAPSWNLSLHLRELGITTWRAATEHPMVREIGAGTLPHDRFRWYFEQNVLYLEDYARAIGMILGKAPDGDALDVLSRFVSQIVHTELPANRAFLKRLGGDVERIDPLRTMHPVAYAYTRHVLNVAGQGTCAEGLTAVLPCQWSYGELAVHLAAHVPDDAVYADWIGMFANDAYDKLVVESTTLLDRLAASADAEQRRKLEWIFDASVRYEVEFWDMAYSGPSVNKA